MLRNILLPVFVMVLVTILQTVSMRPAMADILQQAEGAWAGRFKKSPRDIGIPVVIRFSNGRVVEYAWDGKSVPVKAGKNSNGRISIKGAAVNFEFWLEGNATARALAANKEFATFRKTALSKAARKPDFTRDLYGGQPPVKRVTPRIAAEYLSRKGNFGKFTRKGKHAGVDFAAPRHTSAIATGDGTVTRLFSAYNDFGCGNGLTIRHANGLHSVYCHMESVKRFSVGSRVQMGEFIGTVGSTGYANRKYPHIHFELTKDGLPHQDGQVARTVDPMEHIGGCVSAKTPGKLVFPLPC